MATAADPNTPNPAQPSAQTLTSTAIAIFVGLAWGAVMLLVFGFWMRSKYAGSQDGKIVTNIFLVAGVAAAALAIWQAFTLWMQKLTPEAKAAALEQQRRIFSYVLLGGGIGLILMAFALGFEKKTGNYAFSKDNFAETFGSLLLGLIALGCGYFLQQPLNSHVSPVQFLVGKIHAFKLTFLVVWIAAAAANFYLYTQNKTDFTVVLPEMAGLLLVKVLLIACLIWLNTGQFDEFGIRKLMLVLGGTIGVIIFTMTLMRAYLWRQDIFLGGPAAWQGPNAWHFWLCAYVLFAALVLMFISFNLARADIRKDAVLRRIMYGYDAVVQGMLVIGILAILNVVVFALVPFTFDWTKSRGAYALADSTKNLLTGLKSETHIWVIQPSRSDVAAQLRNMLDNCQAIAPPERLKVHFISPDTDEVKYLSLHNKFPEILPDPTVPTRGVLIVYGPMPEKEDAKTQRAFVGERKLFDEAGGRPGEKRKITFKGEGEIFKELKFLTEASTKRKIYILQGNEEVDMMQDSVGLRTDFRRPFSRIGIDQLVEKLGADNYDVFGLSFNVQAPADEKNPKLVFAKEVADKKKAVPNDCHTLLIAGVSKTLSAEVLDAIDRYIERGGRLMVFVDVVVDDTYSKLLNSGLEPMLRRYGVDITNEFLIRQPERKLNECLVFPAVTPERSENALARQFAGRTVSMSFSARVVKPTEAPGYKAETLLQVRTPPGRFIYPEKDTRFLNFEKLLKFLEEMAKDPGAREMRRAREPVSVAVAVTDKDNKPRMVVFGDTEFITSLQLGQAPRDINYALTASALDWMAEREDLIGVKADERRYFVLDASVADSYWRMVLAPLWLMVLVSVGLGGGFWLVRRK